jgi:glycerophosphoryl diester phosphodiesterase
MYLVSAGRPDTGRVYLDSPLPIGFAHRGGAAVGDENTTAAFGRAVALGYRFIETDTHATADGVAVVFHDDTLERMFGRPGTVRDLRYADLSALRIGGAAAVPRLDEVLDAWPRLRFNIDVKSDAAIEPTLAAVKAAGAEDRVLIASFSDRRLARVRALAGPRIATSIGPRAVGALWAAAKYGGTRRFPPGVAAVQVPPRYGRLRLVTGRFIAAAHRAGLQVHIWTIDEPAEMTYFLDLGVDGIMTDRIEVLRDVYRDRGLWPEARGEDGDGHRSP